MWQRTSAVIVILLALAPAARAAPSGHSVDFEFSDEQYLCPGQHQGGRVYVPENASSEPMPLVVFLHGTNQGGPQHRWLGARGEDLRTLLDGWTRAGDVAPTLLAAPSQTCGAGIGRKLWADFDLDAFVDASERAIVGKATIARDRVVVAGHSGAGCNVSGGLLKVATDRGVVRPLGIVAIDTCLDGDVGQALAQAGDSTRVAAYWQTSSWNRKFTDFAVEFQITRGEAGPGDWLNELDPTGPNPHDALVGSSLVEALAVMLGRGDGPRP